MMHLSSIIFAKSTPEEKIYIPFCGNIWIHFVLAVSLLGMSLFHKFAEFFNNFQQNYGKQQFLVL